MQDAVVDPAPLAEHRQGCKEVGIGGRHPVGAAMGPHGVETAVVDGPRGVVVFEIAHRIEGRAVEELRPEAVGDRPALAARRRHRREDVGQIAPALRLIAPDAMHLRRDAPVDRGMARGGGRGQDRAHPPQLRRARCNPALEDAEKPAPVAPRHPVDDDAQRSSRRATAARFAFIPPIRGAVEGCPRRLAAGLPDPEPAAARAPCAVSSGSARA